MKRERLRGANSMQYMYMYMDAFLYIKLIFFDKFYFHVHYSFPLLLPPPLPLSPLPRVFLNKLSPHKFKNLVEHARELEINTKERLKGCIDEIFSKVHMYMSCLL